MKTILITGARSGIGKALVDRAVARGDVVFAGVRKESDFDAFEPASNLHPIVLDVSSTPSVSAAFDRVDELLAGKPLDVVVNCAAVCPLGAIEVQPIEVIENTLNTNAVGTARMLKEALPRLRGHDGRIALVTSLWGKVSGPMLSAYASSKFAIEAMADSARRETRGQDINIILIEPGVVRTKMVSQQVAEAASAADAIPADKQAAYEPLYRGYHAMIDKNSDSGISADQCAEAIEKAVFANKPKTRYKVGVDAKLVTALGWVLPDRALDAMFAKMFS